MLRALCAESFAQIWQLCLTRKVPFSDSVLRFQMENRVMDKLAVSFWGVSINAEGFVAIAAAVVIVSLVVWSTTRLRR